jgi:hypothetical protein
MNPRERLLQTIEEFSSVFEVGKELKTMEGGPMHIHLKDEKIRPLHICNPRKTPYAFQDTAKAKLDQDEALGIIEKFHGTSKWCSAMSFAPKPNGKVRSVVDLVHLNKFVERPTHPFPTPKDIMAQIPHTAKYFTVFDALHGYWQIPLDEESKLLTTFITENGRYCYLRAPMGLTHPPETSFAPEQTRHCQVFPESTSWSTTSLYTGRTRMNLWTESSKSSKDAKNGESHSRRKNTSSVRR